jgi:hypothetical protein
MNYCNLNAPGFGGGTISVDLDESGGLTAVHRWSLSTGGGQYCYGEFRPVDPPRSWVCHGAPAGPVYMFADKAAVNGTSMGVRW